MTTVPEITYRPDGTARMRWSFTEDAWGPERAAREEAKWRRAINKVAGLRMTPKRKVDEYDRVNLECARIILRDPTRWGGPTSGPAMWARLVIARLDDIASGRL